MTKAEFETSTERIFVAYSGYVVYGGRFLDAESVAINMHAAGKTLDDLLRKIGRTLDEFEFRESEDVVQGFRRRWYEMYQDMPFIIEEIPIDELGVINEKR